MDSAIVTGATGMIGNALARQLASSGIRTLCLGRRPLAIDQKKTLFPLPNAFYASIGCAGFKSLSVVLEREPWAPGDSCVFFHCAWGGASSLTDGTFAEQFSNVSLSAQALMAAKALNCRRFINVGSIEETIAERHVNEQLTERYSGRQPYYAMAKLASRDICRILAYLNKIDYVHARVSAPIDDTLSRGGYIAATLRAILEGKRHAPPQNPQLFDVIPVSEVARALHLIGWRGRNTADYFIGSGAPRTLAQYFSTTEVIARSGRYSDDGSSARQRGSLFSIEQLVAETEYVPQTDFESFIRSLVASCRSS